MSVSLWWSPFSHTAIRYFIHSTKLISTIHFTSETIPFYFWPRYISSDCIYSAKQPNSGEKRQDGGVGPRRTGIPEIWETNGKGCIAALTNAVSCCGRESRRQWIRMRKSADAGGDQDEEISGCRPRPGGFPEGWSGESLARFGLGHFRRKCPGLGRCHLKD